MCAGATVGVQFAGQSWRVTTHETLKKTAAVEKTTSKVSATTPSEGSRILGMVRRCSRVVFDTSAVRNSNISR